MSHPDWFVLIEEKEKGGYGTGLTLPFIVGALAYKSGETNCLASHVRDVLDQMVKNPVDGYKTGVQWCSRIGAPVFSVSQDDGILAKFYFPRPDGSGISLGFSWDLHASNGWSDCKDAQECYEKLAVYAKPHIKKGNFSRKQSPETGIYEYGPFQENDLKFIRETIME